MLKHRSLFLFGPQRSCCSSQKSLCQSTFALPKLKYCQTAIPKEPSPKQLEIISQPQFQLSPLSRYQKLSQESQESFESAHLESAFKHINQSLGFSQRAEIIGVFQLQIQHLKQLHARISELQVLANIHQQKLDALQNGQILIISENNK
ncbi:Hypothetical_protein [Hexamita inflata]|uniref:Hypothetical_protein n=1 Tax=Hexamita inflata TaxID=28002 RepID=A0ABP1GV78_9EUKA